jgi:serine/threonine-protein kinase
MTTISCPTCQIPNRPTAQFCVRCGARLGGVTGRLPANTLLQNRYIIVKTIGGGGMGAVYVATDTQQHGKKWAVKEMSMAQLPPQDIPQAIRDFQHEAELLARLRHPNLPHAQTPFEQNKRWYFVMEYVEGENLLERMNTRGAVFSEHEALEIAKQLCDVLEYLHTQTPPIIFRDLKPANIMLEPNGRIKLIDFGIARFFKPGKTSDTINMGSPDYAALEQFGSGQTDARSDVHAFGATLYHLLVGNPPPKANERALDPKLLIPVQRVNRNVSTRTSNAIDKALAVHPNQRYQSIRELRAALVPTLPANHPITQSPKLAPAQPYKTQPAPTPKIKSSEIETNLNALMIMDLSFLAVKILRKRSATLEIRNKAQTPLNGQVRALVSWLHVPQGNFNIPPGGIAKINLQIDESKYPMTQLIAEPLEIVWS